MTFAPPPPLTEDDLLAVLSRNLDDGWIAGLLADPSARSIFVGLVTALLRVAEASDENVDTGAFLLTAQGPAPATATLEVTRPSGPDCVFTLADRFVDGRGAVWRVSAETAVAASGVPEVVALPIETERRGYFLNSFEVLTYTALAELPGGFEVQAATTPASGGTSDLLGLLGRERSVDRSPGESDDDYRHRLLFLADKVSPHAMAEVVLTVLDGFPATKWIADLIVQDGLRVLREPFRDPAQPRQRGLQGVPAFFLGAHFTDDPGGPLTRDRFDAFAWFEIFLPFWPDPDEARLFFDDGFLDDPLMGFADMPAGLAITLPLATLADELDRRRAGGVRGAIYVGEDQVLDRHPEDGSLSQAGAWVPPAGVSLEEAAQAYQADDAYAETSTGTGAGAAGTVDDLLFEFPTPAPVTPPTTIRRVRLHFWARRASTSVGVDPAVLVSIQPPTSGAPIRPSWDGFPVTIDHDDWRLYTCTLDENPDLGVAWVLGDITAGPWLAGVANAAAAGPTDALRVSELRLEFVVRFD